ncbi:MAG: calcium-binding protein, partial [Planctomycetota bacterium]|nr:calcium-binding protein [Planctomycetota bacterium]
MLRKLGFQKYFVSFRRLLNSQDKSDIREARQLNMELLEHRLLLSVDTDFSGGILTITGSSDNDVIDVSIDPDGALLLNDIEIAGAPTTSNTDGIVIVAGAGDDQITLDQSSGALAPGATSETAGESEIEVTVDAGAGNDALTLRGQDGEADTMKPSGSAVDINGDNDGDVTLIALEEIGLFGGGENDSISLTGWTAADASAVGIVKISVDGGAGDDVLRGGDLGSVTLVGGDGADNIRGGEAAEEIYGGDGDDTLNGMGGQDSLYGEAGSDVIKAGKAGLSTAQNRVYVDAGAGNDTVLTFNGADTIYGREGDDVIRSRPGNDVIYGGPGNDVLDGGNSNDTLYGEAGDDTLQGKKGDDLVYGGADDDVMVNAVVDLGDDTLEGGDGDDLFRMKGRSIAELFEVDWVAADGSVDAHL